MLIINIICILLIVLILFIANINIIELSLYFTTGFKYNHKLLTLPSIISFWFWIIILFIFKLIVSDILNIDLFSLIFYNSNFHSLGALLLIFIGFCIFGILTQAISYMLVNSNKKDSLGIAHLAPIDVLNQNQNFLPNQFETSISNYYDIPYITFSDAITSSIYTFTSLFFVIGILLFIGINFGKNIVHIF